MADHKLTIDTVAVIESLKSHEKKTGKMLCDQIQAQGREAVYLPVETAAQFADAIREVERMCRSLGKKAALHFEIHGNEDGFGLSGGDFVPWEKVRDDIVNLNLHLKNHLLVTMAVCKGTWLLSIMYATETSPFNCLVSSQNVIYEPDIELGFPAFYDAVAAGDTLEEATHKLNLAQSGSQFDLTSTENIFENVFSGYFSQHCNPQKLKEREKNIRHELSKKGVTDRELIHKLLHQYRREIINKQEPMFENYRATFFMHEAYPENMAEFCPTYEEVLKKVI